MRIGVDVDGVLTNLEEFQIKYGKTQKDVVSDNGLYPIYGTGGLMGYATKFLYDKPSVLIGRKGTIDKVRYIQQPFWTVDTLFYTEINEEKILPKFLFYIMSCIDLNQYNEGTTIPSLRTETLYRLELNVPDIETQQKIARVLSAIDDKIDLNNAINKNLEQQAQAIFINMFSNHIENINNESNQKLSELVDNIDNRGKTPPLSIEKTDYPIIDVRALSGDTRVINYNNCTKYVSEDTYNTWFRNGHPKNYDILLSTVGSLAEMKLFMGNIGCIAQNVVGYRCKISPLYMYQYLNYIKHDLLAYDIGSVQPSIKVTHIAKHPIYVPNDIELQQFHEISGAITGEIYSNSMENERLTQLRDTLLPKLMNGEIDVDKVEV